MSLRTGQRDLALRDGKFRGVVTRHQLGQYYGRPRPDVLRHNVRRVVRQQHAHTLHNPEVLHQLLSEAFAVTQRRQDQADPTLEVAIFRAQVLQNGRQRGSVLRKLLSVFE